MTACNAPRALAILVLFSWLIAQAAMAQSNPFDEWVTPIQVGDRLPPTSFVNQHGKQIVLSELSGQTQIIAFIFTHCTDECPLIVQRFGQLDQALGPGSYTLALVTIDPAHDTQSVIQKYASARGIRGRVQVLTGQPHAINYFVRASGESVIDNGTGDLIHNSRLLIVDSNGRLTDVVDDISWNPVDVAAVAKHVSGESSSLLARLDFKLTDSVAALCGGSLQTASGIVDAVAAILVIAAGFIGLAWMRRRIF
jgi:protein SCO1